LEYLRNSAPKVPQNAKSDAQNIGNFSFAPLFYGAFHCFFAKIAACRA